MIEFTLEELHWLHHEVKNIIKLYEHTHSMSKPIINKINLMIEDSTPEKPKSACWCGDKYHPNGFICSNGVVMYV